MPDTGNYPPVPSPQAGVSESLCQERRGHCTASFEGAIKRLERTQTQHRDEWREDFGSFATKIEASVDSLGLICAGSTEKINANKDGIKTLSNRGWGLFVAVAVAVLSGILGLVFSMATGRSEANAAPTEKAGRP